MWRWHEVARWFEEDLGVEVPDYRHAAFLAAVNTLLELQRVVPQVKDARRLVTLLPPELTTALRREPVEDQVGAR
jgi:cell division protein ZapA (FtsZ GTPase activity inhibitor)